MSSMEPTFEQLVSLATGELDSGRAAELENVLRSSPSGASQLARIQAILKTFRAHLDQEPSAGALHRAFAAAARQPGMESWISRIGAQIARCIFDSRLQPAIGLRSGSGTVQLSFAGDLAEMDLELTLNENHEYLLMGHASTNSGEPADEIVIGRSDSNLPVCSLSPNAQGVFRATLSPATYEFVVRCGASTMLVPGVQLT